MAKISEMPVIAVPTGTELVPVLQGTTTKVAPLARLVAAAIPRAAPIPFLVAGEAPVAVKVNAAGQCVGLQTVAGDYQATRAGLRALSNARAPASGRRAPIPFLIGGEPPVSLRVNALGRVVDLVLPGGDRRAATMAGAGLTPAMPVNRQAPISFLIDGEAPISITTNRRGRVIAASTASRRYVGDATGWRSQQPRVGATTYVGGPLATSGADAFGPDTTLIHAVADPRHAIILVGGGQSNEFGHNDDPNDTPYGTAPRYPDHALMFSGGVLRTAAMRGDRTLVPIREQVVGSSRSTCASSWASHTIQLIEARTGLRPTVLTFIAAIGGQPLANLGPGGLPDAWDAFEAGLVDAVAALRARGFERFTVVYGWTQGEAETGKHRLMQRVRALRTHFARVRARIKSITGTTAEPVILMTQTCSMRDLADRWDQPIRQAPLVLDMAGDAVLSGPFYAWPQSLPTDNSYSIHMTCKAQNYHGQMRARATVDGVFGQGHRAVRPVAHRWLSTTRLMVEFDAPAPLTLDTSDALVKRAGLVNGHGLEFDDGSGSPPAFTVTVDDRRLIFDFASAPSGLAPRIANAIAPGNVEKDGPVTGARSILRDTTAHANLYDGTTHANWSAAFVLPVPRG